MSLSEYVQVANGGLSSYLAGPSLVRLRDKETVDKILRIRADILPVSLVEHDAAPCALIKKVLQVLASEGRVAAKQGVGDDAHRPHVYRLSVALLGHHFGGRITKRSSHGLECFVLAIQRLGNAEIGQDEIRVVFSSNVDEVLRLKICDFMLVSLGILE